VAAGLQEPEFRYEQTGLWVEFENPTPEKTPEKILALLALNPNLEIPGKPYIILQSNKKELKG